MKDICKLFQHDLTNGDLKIPHDLDSFLIQSNKNEIRITASPTRKCLLMFSIEGWESLSSVISVGQEQGDYLRKLIRYSHLIVLNNNTVKLPQQLSEWLGINEIHTNLFILACNEKIEIWRDMDLYDYLLIDKGDENHQRISEIKKRLEFDDSSLRLLLNINGVKI